MGDLTTNLSNQEFACKCKYPDCKAHKRVAHMPLVLAIQGAADFFKNKYKATKVSITITCGNRCKKHDVDVQMAYSKKTKAEAEAMVSQHVEMEAADHLIKVAIGTAWMTVPQDELYDYYDKQYPKSHGIGKYPDRIHLDTRAKRARWGD